MEDRLSSGTSNMPQIWQGDRVCSLHEFSKSARVGEG
jgi:hypothetical protein